MVSIEQIKNLREETGVSVAECKKALEQVGGDINLARDFLKKRNRELVQKKSGREAKQGIVATYVHPNQKIGVMIEISCETDFVAKSEEFKKLAHEICLQIAAMKPLFLKTEDIPNEFLDGEIKIYKEQLKDSGKPQKLIDQIIEGKLNKYKKEISLLEQSYIKDDAKTVKDLLNEYVAKLGENIVLKRFSRYEI